MKFLSLLVLSAAGTALARGGGSDDSDSSNHHGRGGGGAGGRWRNNTTPSTKSQCRQLARLTELTSLASDPSKIASLTKNDTTKAAALQAKAAAAAERLATLQSNSTLIQSCSQFLAVEAMEDACWTMARLEKLEKLVANATALEEKGADKAERIKAEVEGSKDELAGMQGNKTLTEFCSVLATKETCRWMGRLERWVERGGNGTRGGDAGGERKVVDAKAELEVLKGNATLVEACAALKAEKDSSSSSEGGSKESSADDGIATAGAGVLQPLGNAVIGLATVFFFGLLTL